MTARASATMNSGCWSIDDHSTILNSTLDNSLVGRNTLVDGVVGKLDIGDTSQVVCKK
jgi:hypothetical protein